MMETSRRSGLTLMVAGVLAVAGSFGSWVTCGTSACDREELAFMVLTPQTGVDFGPGWVTVVLGFALIATSALVTARVPKAARAALIIGGLIVLAVTIVVLATFVLGDPDHYGPNEGLYLVAVGGVLGIAAAWRIRGPTATKS
jgi:amino acid transporter